MTAELYAYNIYMGLKTIRVKHAIGVVVIAQTEAATRAWGANQRLEFIEHRAFWEGGVNRGDLTQKFGVSIPQASNDLARYRNMAPDNLDYDLRAKRYVASATFSPIFDAPSADRYLAQLKVLADGLIGIDDTFIGAAPPVVAMPVPRRVVDPRLLRDLLAALRAGWSVELCYQSMNPERPAPLWRRVTPHALATDGLRWHLRGYCHIDARFKDFILSRVSGLREPAAPGPRGDRDADWTTLFGVTLEPNPVLSPAQRDAIAWEYAMPDGRIVLPVRLALLYYLRKRLRLDVPDDSPSETPVVVANRSQFDSALASARGPVADGDPD